MPKNRCNVWQHFTKIAEDGKPKGVCKYCSAKFASNATRMRCHLAEGCRYVPITVKESYRETVCQQSVASKKKRLTLQSYSSETDSSASTTTKCVFLD